MKADISGTLIKTAELEKLIRELVPVREIHHTLAGCTVSSHCGPRTLGVLFIDE